MRHHNAHRKFSRTSSHRRSLFRNLATALITHEQCETTLEKAKDLRSVVEKLITSAKSNSLAAKRQAYSYLEDKNAVHLLFTEVAPRFSSRPGGYTRVIRSRRRHGDAAEMAVIELVQRKVKSSPKAATPETAPAQ
jgi:large subunit ribosomal protein L17